jgi:membrane-associated phospholipid phosphatase
VLMRSEAYRVLQPPAFVNPYAAMPSLHVGWDLLVGIAVASAASTVVLKWVGCLMPALMAAAVVLTANHYLVDGIAGASLALVGLAGAVGFERLSARRARSATTEVPTPRSSGHDSEHLHDALAS